MTVKKSVNGTIIIDRAIQNSQVSIIHVKNQRIYTRRRNSSNTKTAKEIAPAILESMTLELFGKPID